MRKLASRGRADLLRCLSSQEGVGEAMASLLGYERVLGKEAQAHDLQFDQPESRKTREAGSRESEKSDITFPEERPRLKFLMPVKVETLQPPVKRTDPGNPITDDELRVDWRAPRPALPPLTRWARLAPYLRQRLGSQIPSAQVDVRKLSREFAKGLPLRGLPRLLRQTWAAQAVVFCDVTPEMHPFLEDLEWLVRRLQRERGRHGLEWRMLRRLPQLLDAQKVPPGVPVLVVSAMGQFLEVKDIQHHWQQFGQRLKWLGHNFHALTPCPRARWEAALAQVWPAAVWDRRPRLPRHGGLRVTGHPATAPDHQICDRLLTLLSPASRVEPPLLRTARLMLGREADAGTEWDAWHHEECWNSRECFGFLTGEPYEARLRARRRLSGLDAILAGKISLLMHAHHAGCSGVVAAEAEFRAGRDITCLLQSVVDRLRLLARRADVVETRRVGLAEWFTGMVDRLSPEMRADEKVGALIAEGLACAHACKPMEQITLPAGVEAEIFRKASSEVAGFQTQPVRHRVVFHSQGLDLVPADLPQSPRTWLRTVFLNSSGQFHWRTADEKVQFIRPDSPQSTVRLLTDAEVLQDAVLASDRERLHFEARERPPWARRMYWGSGGVLHAEADLDGTLITLVWSYEEELSPVLDRDYWDGPEVSLWRWYCPSPPTWSKDTKVEIWGDDYGLAAEFRIRDVPFVLRWIPPGTFLMGSPEDEPGRQSNEGPQHEVRITRGFWMGETPVTQAQWRAVVESHGKGQKKGIAFPLNPVPSHFQGPPELPVESVSWEDSTTFCRLLSKLLLNGPSFCLPTEAQWEYTCRAGKQSPIYTGSFTLREHKTASELDQIAWYGGNSAGQNEVRNPDDSTNWLGEGTGGHRAATHRVKLKAPNDFGLYDTLGNVWEWCQDAWNENEYSQLHGGTTDPLINGGTNSLRVTRGGSWLDTAPGCRAAFRGRETLDKRYRNMGLRLAAVECEHVSSPPDSEFVSFSNLTPRAQQMLALARKEADRLGTNYVGAEHLVLGLMKLQAGVAFNVLKDLGVDLDIVRMEMESLHVPAERQISGNLPYTPRVKAILAMASQEAKVLNHHYVGTEHILLGLMREKESPAAHVLLQLGLSFDRCREEILKFLSPDFGDEGRTTS